MPESERSVVLSLMCLLLSIENSRYVLGVHNQTQVNHEELLERLLVVQGHHYAAIAAPGAVGLLCSIHLYHRRTLLVASGRSQQKHGDQPHEFSTRHGLDEADV